MINTIIKEILNRHFLQPIKEEQAQLSFFLEYLIDDRKNDSMKNRSKMSENSFSNYKHIRNDNYKPIN